MASFEGPASSGGELYGAPSSPMTAPSVPEAPKLTPERAQQELARLTAIIKDNPNLHFLEPRVVKCVEVGTQDTATFLSFYRLISQSLSEELMQQKEKIKELESAAVSEKKNSAQNEMEAALAEASEAVNRAQGTSPAAPAAPAAGAPATAPAEVENSAQVDELLKRLEQAEVQRERLLQDMQNMRNRAKTDVDVKVFKAVEKFTQSLLPALDAFHQAMPSLQTATDTASIVTGIEMIHDQLGAALKQAGLQKMEVIGQPFDPHLHEAIGEVQTSDFPDDHIYDELQPGYLFGERMIRAAIVRLARNDGSAAPAAPQADAPAPAQAEAPAAPQAEAPAAPQAETPAAPRAEAAAPVQAEAPTAPQTDAPAPAEAEAPAAPQSEAPAPAQTDAPVAPQPEAAAPAQAEPPSAAPAEPPAAPAEPVPTPAAEQQPSPAAPAPQPEAQAALPAPQASAPPAPATAETQPVAAPSETATPAAPSQAPVATPAAPASQEPAPDAAESQAESAATASPDSPAPAEPSAEASTVDRADQPTQQLDPAEQPPTG